MVLRLKKMEAYDILQVNYLVILVKGEVGWIQAVNYEFKI